MEKIKEKQANDTVRKELDQMKNLLLEQGRKNHEQEMKNQVMQQALVQQANQMQAVLTRRAAPPPPVSSGRLPAPLVPVNPTGPLRFVPTHPTGQQVVPQPTFSTASIGLPSVQQQMMTGVNPQMTGVVSQPTGRANWVNASKFVKWLSVLLCLFSFIVLAS
jgi:hypothetical protein